jgi:hypothetical protein
MPKFLVAHEAYVEEYYVLCHSCSFVSNFWFVVHSLDIGPSAYLATEWTLTLPVVCVLEACYNRAFELMTDLRTRMQQLGLRVCGSPAPGQDRASTWTN